MRLLVLACLPATALAATAEFAEVPVPTGADKDRVVVSPTVTIDGTEHAIGWTPLVADGQQIGGTTWGQLVDHRGLPMTDADGQPLTCNANDFGSLIAVDDALFHVGHVECTPAAMYLTRLEQAADGALSPVSTAVVDATGVRGTNIHCAGDVTPWNTHLASEEYEGDARTVLPDGRSPEFPPYGYQGWNLFAAYWEGDLTKASMYDYGWIPELTVLDADGSTDLVKHYAMGRFSHELAVVMPDRKTVYLSDDGSNGGFFLFVADEADDLSAGTLYAARWNQLDAGYGGSATLSWVNLGHAADRDIAPLLGPGGVAFADVFRAADPNPDGSCAEGLAPVNTMFPAMKRKGGPAYECLAVRPGQERVASRLETRRYAALRGATTEWTKAEGLAVDPKTGTLYLALSVMDRGATAADPIWDAGGRDDIRVPQNKCGGVYAMPTTGGVTDTDGAPIASDQVAVSIAAAVLGEPVNEALCHDDAIANPDNIAWMDGAGLLLIAEDSKRHEHNALWAWTPGHDPVRIATAPAGGEMSGLHYFGDVGGHGYMTLTIQYDWSLGGDEPTGRSVSGTVGPFPVLAD
jgi:secreted PhoX family phosphatase